MHELYSLDRESMEEMKPVHGLIFLFRWRGEKDDRATVEPDPDVFFASQMISNACATQVRAPALECGPPSGPTDTWPPPLPLGHPVHPDELPSD